MTHWNAPIVPAKFVWAVYGFLGFLKLSPNQWLMILNMLYAYNVYIYKARKKEIDGTDLNCTFVEKALRNWKPVSYRPFFGRRLSDASCSYVDSF
jgi:hypothetical protein